ncbi:hypothetical protein [Ktedonospora formicarum]|uniref:hypothetical protein n=1 Tax=Ktedonospora formicarum TaxID=2778364 RepID=UPI001C68E9E0|nr:hypothetical protein [Ktedonospora formicarum]
MKCTHCAAEVAERTERCGVCGAQASETHSTSSPFSYLPAGTPAWPLTIPAYSTGASIAASHAVISPTSIPASKTQQNWLLLSLILLLIPIVGASATYGALRWRSTANLSPPTLHPRATANSQATPITTSHSPVLTTPTSFQTASDTTINMALQYPANWKESTPDKSDTQSSLTISSPDLGIQFAVLRFSESASPAIGSPNDLNERILSELNINQNVLQIQPTQTISAQPQIAGQIWQQKEGLVIMSNGSKVHVNAITVRYNNAYYNIQIYTPEDIYQQALKTYLQPMLDSLHFLS